MVACCLFSCSGQSQLCEIAEENVSNTDEGNYDWRTPNQKEFALMLSEINDLRHKNYAIRTDFSGGNIGWKNTNGFWSDGGRINVDTNGSTGLNIRCVRDNRQNQ